MRQNFVRSGNAMAGFFSTPHRLARAQQWDEPAWEPPTTLSWPLLLGLRWFIWLIWLLAWLFAPWIELAPAEWTRYGLVIGVSLGLNVLFSWQKSREQVRLQHLAPSLFLWDTLAHSILLAWAGGATNPLVGLYLVFIVAAALSLPRVWTWLLALFAVAADGALLHYFHPMRGNWQLALDVRGLSGRLAVWAAFALVVFMVAALAHRYSAHLAREQARLRRMQHHAFVHARAAMVASLAAGAAHELGTPLGTIAIAIRELELTLRAEHPVFAQAQRDTQIIREELNRARQVLDRLAEGGVANPNERQLLEIAVLERELRSRLENPECLHVVARLGHVLVHRAGLMTILFGLVRNAMQSGARKVSVVIERQAGHALFRVSDDGPGIPLAILARLGQPFVHPPHGLDGLGLGLFCAYLLAEQLGGHLAHHNLEGGGTLATLRLPELQQRSGLGDALSLAKDTQVAKAQPLPEHA